MSAILTREDGVLQACMRRIFSAGQAGDATHDDTGVFDRRTLAQLVAHVDGHLKLPRSLEDMPLRTGLSTGLSLHRLVNRRRILRSLDRPTDHS